MSSNNHLQPDHDGTSAAAFGALQGTHWIETLRDGTGVLIRPLRAKHREREDDFIKRLSPDARHFRLLGDFKQASPALIDQSIDVD